jgi:hypothetical protein
VISITGHWARRHCTATCPLPLTIGDDELIPFPHGVAVDSLNNVHVANFNFDRIQKFNSDGIFLATIGTQGSGDGELKNPTSVAIDLSGNIYVAAPLTLFGHHADKISPSFVLS